jgi:hypothetical protein
LGWQMGLLSIVLAPFVGAYSVDNGDWAVEALPRCVSNESPLCGVVSTGPAVDTLQLPPPLFGMDAAL